MVSGRSLFVGILALSQSVLGVAASSGASDVIASFNNISDQCHTLNSTLNNFVDDAGVTGTALKLQGQASDLLKTIKDGTDVADKTSDLESADQKKIADAVVPISRDVDSLIDGFVAKKPVF